MSALRSLSHPTIGCNVVWLQMTDRTPVMPSSRAIRTVMDATQWATICTSWPVTSETCATAAGQSLRAMSSMVNGRVDDPESGLPR